MPFDGVKVGALWKNKGEGYSGTIDADEFDKFVKEHGSDSIRLLLFKNGFKEEDKHPDLVLYFAPDRKKAHTEKPSKGKQKPSKGKTEDDSDDVPF